MSKLIKYISVFLFLFISINYAGASDTSHLNPSFGEPIKVYVSHFEDSNSKTYRIQLGNSISDMFKTEFGNYSGQSVFFVDDVRKADYIFYGSVSVLPYIGYDFISSKKSEIVNPDKIPVTYLEIDYRLEAPDTSILIAASFSVSNISQNLRKKIKVASLKVVKSIQSIGTFYLTDDSIEKAEKMSFSIAKFDELDIPGEFFPLKFKKNYSFESLQFIEEYKRFVIMRQKNPYYISDSRHLELFSDLYKTYKGLPENQYSILPPSLRNKFKMKRKILGGDYLFKVEKTGFKPLVRRINISPNKSIPFYIEELERTTSSYKLTNIQQNSSIEISKYGYFCIEFIIDNKGNIKTNFDKTKSEFYSDIKGSFDLENSSFYIKNIPVDQYRLSIKNIQKRGNRLIVNGPQISRDIHIKEKVDKNVFNHSIAADFNTNGKIYFYINVADNNNMNFYWGNIKIPLNDDTNEIVVMNFKPKKYIYGIGGESKKIFIKTVDFQESEDRIVFIDNISKIKVKTRKVFTIIKETTI